MPILNYTTTVPATKSVSEIASLLVRKGAQSITHEYFEDGRVKSVSFVLQVGDFAVPFLLPANIEGVAGVLCKERPYTYRSRGGRDRYYAEQRQQAERISWRILKDWVEAQIALIESGQAEPAQVFLPYAKQADGRTMYDLFLESKQKSLPAPAPEKCGSFQR
jgi:hypothetical protein